MGCRGPDSELDAMGQGTDEADGSSHAQPDAMMGVAGQMMQRYQFDRIFSEMEKEFGKLDTYADETYVTVMFPIEGNALKVHRAYPTANSRRFKEALALVLFDIKERCTGRRYDTKRFRNADNERLEHAILMAFDPFTNEEVMAAVNERFQVDEFGPEEFREYYLLPVMCLIKLKDSADLWERNLGADGYFTFIEDHMGAKIRGDEMAYGVAVPQSMLAKADDN